MTPDARAAEANRDAGVRRGGLLFTADGGYQIVDAAPPPPVPLEPDEVVPAEPLIRRELLGVVLQARWIWRDLPKPPEAPQVNAAGVKLAQDGSHLGWRVEMTETGRLRAVFESVAMPLPKNSELLSRADRYGGFALWPNGGKYRVLGPGALRATLGERRVDVTPLSTGKYQERGAGKRLELTTRKVQLSSPLGQVVLETAKIPEAGRGAVLLCRMMAEIVGVHPSTEACVAPEVVLHADFSWTEGGGIQFEVRSVARRSDLPAKDFLAPPPGARYAAHGLPASPGSIFFTRDELAAFRTEATEPPNPPHPEAPGEGLSAVNQSDRLMYLLVDGVPIVAPPPWSERYVIGLRHGRYRLQWRTFLGELIEPPQEVDLPARVEFGAGDAGAGDAPDGG